MIMNCVRYIPLCKGQKPWNSVAIQSRISLDEYTFKKYFYTIKFTMIRTLGSVVMSMRADEADEVSGSIPCYAEKFFSS